MPHKILYLNRTAEIGGAEISLLLLLRGLDQTKYCALVVIPSAGPLCERLRAMGVDFRIEPLAFLKAHNPLSFLDSVRRLVRIIKSEGISFVHANVYMSNQYGVIAARLAGVKIISHVRLILGPLAIRNSFLKYANHLIANSHAVAHALQAARIPKEKISVVWNGVDLKVFCPDGTRDGAQWLRQRLGIPRETFLLGTIGRIHPSKGYDILIQAMASLKVGVPQIMALIVGDTKIDRSDNYLNRLKGLAGEYGLETRVHFLPFQEDIITVYDAVDLVILPSVAEPFGRVLIEAMAMEKPVVATRAGGAVEIVEDGETGLLVPPDDINGLVKAIMTMLESEEDRKQVSRAGRIRVKNMFSIQKNVEETQKIYMQVLNKIQ